MSVFNNVSNYESKKIFFDDSVGIARYDTQKYSFFEKLTERQMGYFWLPTEVDLSRDSKDFKQLTPSEQHVFTSNLKRQILLDSIQGRAPSLAFLPICSLPEIENWIQAWTFFETIHSRSYTHIIRNVYSNPSVVFEDMTEIQEIVACGNDISKYYDTLIEWNSTKDCGGHDCFSYNRERDSYYHKKHLWNALMAVNILEGIRFYVSFACSWAFAELKRMEGNAKIIKFIARDENLHLASTQQLLKILPKDDEDYAKVKEENRTLNILMFIDAVNQEKEWAKYLFKDGSMVGLNDQLLCDYIEWIAHKRMTAVGLDSPYKGGSNPLPWTQKWISGSDVQVAPQETEITSYVVGGVNNDVNENTFKGISL